MSIADGLLPAQAQVLESIIRGAPLSEVLESLCRIVEAHAGTSARAAIMLVDGDRLRMRAAPNLPTAFAAEVDGLTIAPDVGTCLAAAARAEPVITTEIATAPSWTGIREVAARHGLAAAWSMPILSSTGIPVGTFGTYFLEPRPPHAEERALVEVLARTAALAIERQQADRAARAAAERSRFLLELDQAMQRLTEPGQLMAACARMLAEHLGADRCAYAQVEDERFFDIVGDFARGVPSIVGRWDVAAFGAECNRQMLAGEPYIVEDIERDPRLDEASRAAHRAAQITAVICVPLHKDGMLTAAMAVHQAHPRSWKRDEVEIVTNVVARCWETLERIRVSTTLAASEARYRAIVEASPECVKLLGPDGTLLQMNQAGLAMIEAPSAEAVLGACVYDVIAPEHRERFQAFNQQVCRGIGGTLEFDIIAMRGTRRSMETTAVPLPAAGGGFMQLAITRDVSARVASERALTQSRARLDYAVRLSGVGFWYCDLPFDELIWDERVKEHFFLPPDARVTIETFYERIQPEDRETTRAAIESSIANRGSYDVVYRTVEPSSGRVRHIRALGGTAYAPDGTPLRFDGVTVDVTAQRLDQERIARLAAAALTIHSSSTLDSVLRVVNEEARAIIGAHQAVTSLTDGANWEQAINHVSLSDKYKAFREYTTKPTGAGIYRIVLETGRPMRLTHDELLRHPAWRGFSGEGDRHPAMRGYLAVPLVARNGESFGLVQLSDKYDGDFSAADEAALVQLAQLASVAIDNARLYDELREQDRRKDEFLATLAHELRNPLAPIRTGLALLDREAEPTRAAQIRQRMERQLGHLVRMVDDLLDISRITLGKISLAKAQVDLRTVLDAALETTRELVESKRHSLTVNLPDRPLVIDADVTRLAQVFANLVNNAARYTPAGGFITIDATRDGSWLVVRVIDNGIGIPADMVTRVFDMFTQVGRSIERSQGGLGVGLTLVRRLVDLHGGTVEATSAGPNQGTTFTVRMPLAPGLSHATPPRGTAAIAPHAMRVLIVDDNIDGAETLAQLLELEGHRVQMAHTGPDALSAAVAFRPQAVLLDIGLPGLSGYEVAQRIRADPALPQPVLIALTGWGTEEDRRQAQAAGFDKHLVKPVDTTRLTAVLAEIQAATARA